MEILSVDNLTKKFGGFAAVDNLTFKIKKGQITSIIGPNGAGKTTAIRLISGEIAPTSGHINFKGINITKSTINKNALLGISRTFQVPSVFNNLTVLDNLKIAIYPKIKNNKEIENKCKLLLDKVGMSKEIDAFPEALSNYQKRILEWCMSAIQEPEIILMDELGAGLSDEELGTLYEIIKESAQNITPLFVEHRLEFVFKISEKIIVLDQGKKLAEGSPEDILRNKEVKEAYFGDNIREMEGNNAICK